MKKNTSEPLNKNTSEPINKNTFKPINNTFKDFRDTSENSSDEEFSLPSARESSKDFRDTSKNSSDDEEFSFPSAGQSSDDELTNSRPEAPLNIPRYAPKIFRREAVGGLTNDIDLSSVSGRKRVIGSLDDLTTPLNDMNIDAGSATSQIPSLSCIPDPTTEVRKEKNNGKEAKTACSFRKPNISSEDPGIGKTNR
jgi:hypothetical protein